MDGELAQLALTGATTVVTLMATDVWTRVREAVAAIFRGRGLERIVTEDLDRSRARLLSVAKDAIPTVQNELTTEWHERFSMLIANDQATARAFEVMLATLEQHLPPPVNLGQLNMQGTANDRGRVYQQGQGVQHNH